VTAILSLNFLVYQLWFLLINSRYFSGSLLKATMGEEGSAMALSRAWDVSNMIRSASMSLPERELRPIQSPDLVLKESGSFLMILFLNS
jgi:hypothetical protein